jgi:hypothetical protein
MQCRHPVTGTLTILSTGLSGSTADIFERYRFLIVDLPVSRIDLWFVSLLKDQILVISSPSTTYLLPGFENGRTSRTRVSQSPKRFFLFCLRGLNILNSQGKLFIGLILNVMLFGINITQTYIYYIHSKKCVSRLRYSNNSSMSVLFVYFRDRLWIKFSVG